MVQLELNADQANILHRVLLSYLDELRSEIATTDMEGLGDLLLQEQEIIVRLVQRLETTSRAPRGGTGEYVG